MSKIIETLQKPFVESDNDVFDVEQKQEKKERYNKTQEQLADIYFGANKTPKEKILEEPLKELPPPTVIKVVESKRTFIWPWVVTTLALLVCSLALFSTKKVSISIRVTDENKAIETGVAIPINPEIITTATKALTASIPEISFISPMQFGFAGGAALNSTKTRELLTLTNSSLSNISYAYLDYDKSFNANNKTLFFEVRGMSGGETFEVIFSDEKGNSSLNWKSLIPYNELSTSWQPVQINVESAEFFDAERIQQIRIEFGTQRTHNTSNATALFKNFQWMPIGSVETQPKIGSTEIISESQLITLPIESPIKETESANVVDVESPKKSDELVEAE